MFKRNEMLSPDVFSILIWCIYNNINMECCGEMYVDTETSELVCKSCGRVETIMGVAFDKHQFFDQAQKGQPPSTKKK